MNTFIVMIFDINQERVDKKFPNMRTRKGSATSGSFFFHLAERTSNTKSVGKVM